MIAKVFLDQGAAGLVCDYHESFIYSFKMIIPKSLRVWVKEAGVWYFPDEYLLRVVYLLIQSGYRLRCDSAVASRIGGLSSIEPVADHDLCSAFLMLQTYPGASLEVCKAAYRTLAKSLHADVGGDHDQMLVLNEAISKIENFYT